MFGIGTTELVLILLVILLLFGATRLPNALGGLGKGVKEFRKGFKGEDGPEDDETAVDSPVVAELKMAIGSSARFSPDGTMEIGIDDGESRLVDVDASWAVLENADGKEKIPIVSVKRLVTKG